MTDKLTEMWVAFKAHEPEPAYAEEWATMLKERTEESMWAAYYAAPSGSAAWWAAEAAAWAAEAAQAARRAAKADRYAQEAIDAIRGVKP